MITRNIPSSNEIISVIGIGSWAKFESDNTAIRNVMKTFTERGGKLIDTSPMYGNAETVIGTIASASFETNAFFYATKVWTTGRESGIKQMESSMHKLNRAVIDLIQIHNLVDWQTHLKTLLKWKEEGKIRYTGITHYTVHAHEQLEKIIKNETIDFVQFNYSIRERNAERSLLNTAKNKNVAVIINEPLDKGTLFSLVKGKSLPQWALENDMKNWAQFFLKYVISHPAVTCVIPATSNPQNLKDNMSAGYGQLPNEELRKKMVAFIKSIS